MRNTKGPEDTPWFSSRVEVLGSWGSIRGHRAAAYLPFMFPKYGYKMYGRFHEALRERRVGSGVDWGLDCLNKFFIKSLLCHLISTLPRWKFQGNLGQKVKFSHESKERRGTKSLSLGSASDLVFLTQDPAFGSDSMMLVSDRSDGPYSRPMYTVSCIQSLKQRRKTD